MGKILAGIIFLQFTILPLEAHRKEEHEKKTLKEVIRGSPALKDTEEIVKKESYRIPSLKESLFEHFHNTVVHFPIAFALGGSILFLLSLWIREMESGARAIVILGTIAVIITLITGQIQSSSFEEESKRWLVNIHRVWGIVSTLSFLVWTLICHLKPLRRYAWLWGLVVSAIVLITGFYGGLISHG
jgi:uncharacterized membrane protein